MLVLQLPSILVDEGDEGAVKLGFFLFGHGACLLFLAWFVVAAPRGRGAQAFAGAAGRRGPHVAALFFDFVKVVDELFLSLLHISMCISDRDQSEQ